MPATYLVTGSSRGLGFVMATELSKRGNFVIASSRGDPPPALVELINGSNGQVKHVKLDATSRSSAEEARSKVEAILGDKGLDVLINNAGAMPWTMGGVASMSDSDLESTFKTNVASVHIVTSTFLPLLRKGTQKKVANISTTLGSIARAGIYYYGKTDVPSYKVTKSALNMLTVQYALSYADEGFTFLAVTPGWLKTDLGSERADLEVEVGARATLDVIEKNGKESSGKFLNIIVPGWEEKEGINQYDGKGVEW